MQRFNPTGYNLKTFGEVATALALARGNAPRAAEIARNHPAEMIDAASDRTRADMFMRNASLTTDAGLESWTPASQAFTEGVIAQSILGRIRGTRQVPFNRGQISLNQLAGSAGWVAEGGPKTAPGLDFGSFALQARKVAVMCVLSIDALRIPGADELVRTYLERATAEKIDTTLVSADAAVDGESPAGLGANAVTVASTGSTPDKIVTDLRAMVDAMVTARASLDAAGWILSPQAWALYKLLKIGDPDGTLAGFPVVSSSAANGTVTLLAASYLGVASSAPVTLTASQHATVEIPNGTTAGRTVNLFQQNLVALMAESRVNWELSGPVDSNGTTACVQLTGATYA